MKIKIREKVDILIPKLINFVNGNVLSLQISDSYKNIIYPVVSVPFLNPIFIPPTIKTFYVSNTGNDNNTGEMPEGLGSNGPVATLQKATQIASNYTGSEDLIEIQIRAGVYQILGTETKPVLFLEGITKSITYKNYNSEQVIISGSENIPYTRFNKITSSDPKWNRIKNSVKNNIYVADVSEFDLGEYPIAWYGRNHGTESNLSDGGGDSPGVPHLFFNDIQMTVSRWPNKSGITSSGFFINECATISNTFGSVIDTGTSKGQTPKRNGIFKYRDEYHSIIKGWFDAGGLTDGGWITIFPRYDWRSETYKIVGVTLLDNNSGGATAAIKIASANSPYALQNYSFCNGDPDYKSANTTPRRWFIQNIIDELDVPGEYFIDRTNKKLYFYPPYPIGSTSSIQFTHRANRGPAPLNKVYPLQENYERGYNAATGKPVIGTVGNTFGYFPYPGWTGSYIKNVGYNSQGSIQSRHVLNTKTLINSMFKFYKCKNIKIEGLIFKNCSGTAIKMDTCSDMVVKNCQISNMKRYGIRAEGCKRTLIENCTIKDIDYDAVILTGGNKRTLTPSGNIITKCDIQKWGRGDPTEAFGIVLIGCGNVASRNTIRNAGGQAIKISASNYAVIEYNYFNNLLKEVDDAGVIFAGRQFGSTNNTIRYNFFDNISTSLPGGRSSIANFPYPNLGDPLFSGCTGPIGVANTTLSTCVYFEYLESFQNVIGNVFYRCINPRGCIFAAGGVLHNISNNIFIDSSAGFLMDTYNYNFWNTHFNTPEFAGRLLNLYDDPWYEEDPGYDAEGKLAINTGYNVYNNTLTKEGLEYYFRSGNKTSQLGLMPVVDITSNAYKAAEPRYLELFTVNGVGTNALLGISLNYAKSKGKNDYYNNVVIGCCGSHFEALRGISTDSNPLIGGISGSDLNLVVPSFTGFTDKSKLNFKLTTQGLSTIRSFIPGFNNIPFEEIPQLPIDPDVEPVVPPPSQTEWLEIPGTTPYVLLNNINDPKSVSISVNKYGCLVTNGGKVICFGNNNQGQCSVPSGINNAVQVACGYNHTVALLENGTIVGWGATGSGTGNLGTQVIQQQITSAGLTVKKIDAGGEHALALLSNDAVVAWGKNETAQLSDTNVFWTWPNYLFLTWPGGYAPQGNELFQYFSDRSGLYNGGNRSYRCSSLPGKRQSGCESPNGSTLESHWLWKSDGTTLSPASLLTGSTGWEQSTGAPYDYQFSRATTNDINSVNFGGGGWIPAPGSTSALGTSLKTYSDISAGRSHNLLLANDGTIELWGLNWYYPVTGSGKHSADNRAGGFKRAGSGSGTFNSTLGKIIDVGDNTSETVKQLKLIPNSVSKIATSYYGNIIIKPDGSVFAWDRNECGECTGLTLGSGITFAFVNGAYRHNLGIGTNGALTISGCWISGGQSFLPYIPNISNKFTWAGGSQNWSAGVLDNGNFIVWGTSIPELKGLTLYSS